MLGKWNESEGTYYRNIYVAELSKIPALKCKVSKMDSKYYSELVDGTNGRMISKIPSGNTLSVAKFEAMQQVFDYLTDMIEEIENEDELGSYVDEYDEEETRPLKKFIIDED